MPCTVLDLASILLLSRSLSLQVSLICLPISLFRYCYGIGFTWLRQFSLLFLCYGATSDVAGLADRWQFLKVDFLLEFIAQYSFVRRFRARRL